MNASLVGKLAYRGLRIVLVVTVILALLVVLVAYSSFTKFGFINQYAWLHAPTTPKAEPEFFSQLAQAAESQLAHKVTYNSAYYAIPYPMGDIPAHLGVCSDVVIRAYRVLGVDLQQLVHQDLSAHFLAYPKMWRSWQPDTNIDHRRVPNLMTFFNRAGAALPLSEKANDYQPGDLVVWNIGHWLTHIGVVASQRSAQSGNPLILHNIGAGVQLEDQLFANPIIGHYRYRP